MTRNNAMRLGPITHQEITAWAEGMRYNLLPFERQCIRAIDRAYLLHLNSKTPT